MVWFDYLWLEGDDGNLEHVTEHDLTSEDVEYVFENFEAERTSRKQWAPDAFWPYA